MNISKRLECIASFVTVGNTMADIGTDHGYIPIYLALRGIVPKAVAMDINEGPLTRAKENIEKYDVSNIVETRLGDGLNGLKIGEVKTIVIAGMGGLLINRILEDNEAVAKSAKELVLSPHSDIALVRQYLVNHEFKITCEDMVYDEGKYYFIIKCINGRENEYDDFSLRYGKYLNARENAIFKEYLQFELNKKNTILQRLHICSSNVNRIHEIEKEIAFIKRGLGE